MKIIPFAVPHKTTESFYVFVDNDQERLYPHLHQHPEIQVTLIVKMEGVLIAHDYVGDFSDGDVFVLGPNQPHVFRNNEYQKRKPGAAAISLFFNVDVLGSHFMDLPEMRMAQVFINNCSGGFKIHGAAKKHIATNIKKLITAKNISRMVIFMDILKWLSGLKDRSPLSTSSFQKPVNEYDNKRINEVVDYTMTKSDEPIRLAEVAGIAGMTPEAFCKYFKSRTKKTYFQFLNEIRIHKACNLLMQGGPTVATVSRLTGFNSISNFNRNFKKTIGVTPVEYVHQSVELEAVELP